VSRIVNKKKTKINLILKRLFFVFIFIYLFWLMNNFNKISILSNYIEIFSKKYDYLFKNVEINNLNYISELEIKKFFEKYYNKSIFLIPIKDISEKIEKNRWIESLTVHNSFKNTIFINIKELETIGLYFDGQNYFLISKYGDLIDVADEKEIKKYIILEGQNAFKLAPKLIELIPDELKSIITKAHYVNNRRWNITTKDNIKILLPEIEYKQAMDNFINIYDNLYSSDINNIEYIDLRLSKKMIIKHF